MKFGKLSMAAAAVLVGGVLVTFSGCGHDRDIKLTPSAPEARGSVPTDGYVIALNAFLDGNTSNDILKSQDLKTYRMTYTKTAAELADKNISVVGKCIDVDVSGDCNYSKGDKSITFPLLTQGATPYVNGATTLAVLTGDKKLLEQAGNVDTTADIVKAADNPVVAQVIALNRIVGDIVNNDPAKLTVVADIVKDVNISQESDVTELVASIKKVAEEKGHTDIAEAAAAAGVKVVATVKTIKALETQTQLDKKDIVKLSSVLMEGDEKQIESTLQELNVNDENITKTVQVIIQADKTINEKVTPKLALTAVYFGQGLLTVPVLAVPVDANKTIGNFGSIAIDSHDHNLSDYYSNIQIDVTKDRISKNGSYRADFVIEVKDEQVPSNRVTIGLSQVDITLDANKSGVTTVMTPNTSIFVEQEGLPQIEKILGNYAEAKLDRRLVNTDLTFDLNTVLNALSSSDSNNEKIKNAIAALNNYFKKEGKYSVSMELTNVEPLASTPKDQNLFKQLAFNRIEGEIVVHGEPRNVTPPADENNTHPTLKPIALKATDIALHTYVLKSNDSNEEEVVGTFCPNGQAVVFEEGRGKVVNWSIVDGNTLQIDDNESSKIQFFGTALTTNAAYKVIENGEEDDRGVIANVYDDSKLVNCAIFTEKNTTIEMDHATLTTTAEVVQKNGPFVFQFEANDESTQTFNVSVYANSVATENLILFNSFAKTADGHKYSVVFKGTHYSGTLSSSVDQIVLK